MITNSDFERFFSITMQFGKLMSRYTQDTLEEKTATMLQLMALQLLKDQPSETISDLANSLKLSKSSATQLVERLVEASFVRRLHDKKDRRIIRLVITENGEKKFTALRKKLMKKMQTIFSKIPAKDFHELIRIYTDLIETLKKEQ